MNVMIDTVCFIVDAIRRPGIEYLLDEDEGWEAGTWQHRVGSRFAKDRWSIENKRIGLMLREFGKGQVRASVNLPKLMFGHNGRLITDEIWTTAWKWVDYVLRTLIIPPPHSREVIPGSISGMGGKFTQVDLVWQFPATPELRALTSRMRHPKIRSAVNSFNGGESHSLRGALLQVTRYDKTAELHLVSRGEPHVDRLEIRITDKGIKQYYPLMDPKRGTRLHRNWCWNTLRKVLSEMDSAMHSPRGLGLPWFLAWAEQEIPAKPVFEVYTTCVRRKRRTVRRLRRETDLAKGERFGYRALAGYFPDGRWPDVHEVIQFDKEEEAMRWRTRFAEMVVSTLGAGEYLSLDFGPPAFELKGLVGGE